MVNFVAIPVNMDRWPMGDYSVSMRFQQGKAMFKKLRKKNIIGAGADPVHTSGVVQKLPPRRVEASIFRPAKQLESAVILKRLEGEADLVSGPVVKNEHFEVAVGLGLDGTAEFRQVIRAVVRRHQNTDQRRASWCQGG